MLRIVTTARVTAEIPCNARDPVLLFAGLSSKGSISGNINDREWLVNNALETRQQSGSASSELHFQPEKQQR